MVSPEDVDLLGVLDLESEEQADGLDALPSPVDVVSQEEVVGFRGEAAVFEQSEHVVVLSMDVSADLDWGGHLDQHGLLHEYGLDEADRPHNLGLVYPD